MSTYVREKVLRLPVNRYVDVDALEDIDDFKMDFEKAHPGLFSYGTVGKFSWGPCDDLFIDFVIDREYDAYDGEWGKTRALYPTEAAKYYAEFHRLFSEINMADVRLVEFCWYNCTEADSYYDEVNDPFYKEI